MSDPSDAPFVREDPFRFERDAYLLRQFVEHASQAAFAALVARHMRLVYATCLREVGTPELAQDATQVVFLLLARKAATLRKGHLLTAWLFQTARFTARDLRKQERHRQKQEQIVMKQQHEQVTYREHTLWEQTQPFLNQALATLKPAEREAVLLRFFEGCTLNEIGIALGISEDAARMRVQRAVTKLRHHLAKAGLVLSLTTLIALLTQNAVQAEPLPAILQVLYTGGSVPLSLMKSRNLKLTKGVQNAMNLMRLRYAAATTASVVALATGGSLLQTHATSFRSPQSPSAPVTLQSYLQAAPPPQLDMGLPVVPAVQLPEPFTLNFDMVEQDVSTPEMQATKLRSFRKSYDIMVQKGEITSQQAQDQVNRLIEAERLAVRMKRATFTVSARAGKLFYRRNEVASSSTKDIYEVCVFDGKQSLHLFSNSNQAEITPGYALWHTNLFPLPGLGLPHIPLLRAGAMSALPLPAAKGDGLPLTARGNVPQINAMHGVGETPTIVYAPGILSWRMKDRKPQVLRSQVFQGEHLVSQWEFTQHRLFNGVWIAGRIRFTDFEQGQPTRYVTFTLQQVRDVAYPADQFSFATWLTPDMQVVAYGGGTEVPSFKYNLEQRTWVKQGR